MNLVVGATGHLGGRITEKLLKRGEKVRVLVRSQSAYEQLQEKDAEVCYGDLKDPLSFSACFKNVKTIYCTATSTQRGGADTVESVDRKGIGDLIEAADTAGVEQFVYVTVTGAYHDSPAPLFRAKAENEMRLASSSMRHTFLRPVLFMESWIGVLIGSQLQQGNKVQIIGDGHKKASFISLEDVAEVAVRTANSQQKKLEVPISAEALSYREVISLAAELMGEPIHVEVLEPGGRIQNVPAQIRDILTELMTGLALGPEMNLTTPEVAEKVGIRFTTVKDYLSQALVTPALAGRANPTDA
jgi:uncharacterized protein YbjT (DUF2867 family)